MKSRAYYILKELGIEIEGKTFSDIISEVSKKMKVYLNEGESLSHQFVLLEIGSKDILKEYYSVKEMLDDLQWKCPESFWIGVIGEKQSYTIPQILEKYN